jgi:hypothetical protein
MLGSSNGRVLRDSRFAAAARNDAVERILNKKIFLNVCIHSDAMILSKVMLFEFKMPSMESMQQGQQKIWLMPG